MKTLELTFPELNRVVGFARGDADLKPVPYSTNWQYGGPVIEAAGISLQQGNLGYWYATLFDSECKAETALEAAMRCYVLHTLGEEFNL